LPDGELSFLVVHGGALWWLLPLAAGVAGAALVIARSRRAHRRRSRAALHALRDQLIAPGALRDGARAALRGRLVGPPGAAAVGLRLDGREVAGGPLPAGHGRAQPELALELAGDAAAPARLVALAGPLSVVAGAEVITGSGRDVALIAPPPLEARALARQVPWNQPPEAVGSVGVLFSEMHRIPVGSAVLVAGRLALGPASSADAGYRDAAERWTLVGSDTAPLRLGSEAPGLPPWSASRWVRGFAIGVAIALASMWAGGALTSTAAPPPRCGSCESSGP